MGKYSNFEENIDVSEKEEANSVADADSISLKTPLRDKVRSSSHVTYKFLNPNDNSGFKIAP
jgi:hypothetical protein